MPTSQDIQNQINALIDPRVESYLKSRQTAKSGEEFSSYDLSHSMAKQMQDMIRGAYGSAELGAQDVNAIRGLLGKNMDQMSVQGLNQYLQGVGGNQEAQRQLSDYRNQYLTQAFGSPTNTLSQALAPGGTNDLSQLNSFLGGQESSLFNREMRPEINMALGSMGLGDSGGAELELKTKALAGLEESRQRALMQAALGYRDQSQGMQRSDILGGIGTQQQNLGNLANQQNALITMNFQRELEEKRANLAYQLSQHSGGGGGLQAILGGVGTAAAIGLAPFTGGASLTALGPSMGMLGQGLSQNSGGGNMGSAMAGMGGAFGSMGSSFFTPNQQSQSGQQNKTGQPIQQSGPGPWRSGYQMPDYNIRSY